MRTESRRREPASSSARLPVRSSVLGSLAASCAVLVATSAASALIVSALRSRPERRPERPVFSAEEVKPETDPELPELSSGAELKRLMEQEDARATRRMFGTTVRVRAAEVGR